jgi:hypothetical protein
VAKHRSGLNQALTVGIASLLRFTPYSTSPDYKVWKDTLEGLREVQAGLEIVDAFRPGIVDALVDTAYEEARIGQGDAPKEISALIGRYCTRREKLR